MSSEKQARHIATEYMQAMMKVEQVVQFDSEDADLVLPIGVS